MPKARYARTRVYNVIGKIWNKRVPWRTEKGLCAKRGSTILLGIRRKCRVVNSMRKQHRLIRCCEMMSKIWHVRAQVYKHSSGQKKGAVRWSSEERVGANKGSADGIFLFFFFSLSLCLSVFLSVCLSVSVSVSLSFQMTNWKTILSETVILSK